jgi:hypothetical protein
VVDRTGSVERLYPAAERNLAQGIRRRGRRNPGDNQGVRRLFVAVGLVAVALGATAWRLADVKPDPNVQAIADGCQRDTTKIYTGFAPNWVYVNDRDFPATGAPPPTRSAS